MPFSQALFCLKKREDMKKEKERKIAMFPSLSNGLVQVDFDPHPLKAAQPCLFAIRVPWLKQGISCGLSLLFFPQRDGIGLCCHRGTSSPEGHVQRRDRISHPLRQPKPSGIDPNPVA